MIVRAATDADRPEWDALYDAYAQFYEVPQTPEMRAKVWGWIADPANEVNAFVADADGVLVGIAHYRAFMRPLAAASGLFLDDLFVSPAARGSGAAAALIGAVKDAAKSQGHSVVRWITAADNARARGLYDKVAQAGDWVTYDINV
ncbi:GNAT family N-acetyltransferase [Octadecabacter sp. G9-8]|uniref:GNAT family N-acetyltransferase n=1 Tax=Octadecabacter dasysiphoniae TaxID=2909341 RepID=A0ABS9CSI0_9RHOB|nr:GNAT family N-acetyltransferase [Octadecabacter dasysiphoniae]MCF2869814.1 GNAT family N-acetyltransferase [Octadecabacter dasysiphoniae]